MREIFVGICVGVGTFILKIIANMDLYSMLFFIPILVLLSLLSLWIYLLLISEKNVSEIAALATGVSNITAVLLGVLVLGEALSIHQVLGLVIILTGMVTLKFKKSA